MEKIVIILICLAFWGCGRQKDLHSEIDTTSCPDVKEWHHWTAVQRSDYYMIINRDEQDSLVRHILFCPSYKNDLKQRFLRCVSGRRSGEYCEVDLTSPRSPNKWLHIRESMGTLHDMLLFLDKEMPKRVCEDQGVLYVTLSSGGEYAFTDMQMDTIMWAPLDNKWYYYKEHEEQ